MARGRSACPPRRAFCRPLLTHKLLIHTLRAPQLHPELVAAGDARVGAAAADGTARVFRVPARTAAVFVQPR